MVNQLQSNITWGQRGNFVAVPTDCPQRDERLGWLADAQIFAPTASRNADVSAFFARWMRDVVDGQDADGAFRDVAPVISLHREAAPAWGDAGVIIPWHLWRTYGDRARAASARFDAMVAWVEHIRRHNPDLRWRHRTGNSYGDWLQVDASTPRDVLSTAYFARSAQIVADAAEVLGRHAEAAEHRALHARDPGGVHRRPTSATTAPSRAAPRPATCWPWRSGCCREGLVPAAVEHLAADIEKRGQPADHRVRRRRAALPGAGRPRPGRPGVRAAAPGGVPVLGLLDPARRHHDLGALGRLDRARRLPVRRDELVQPLQPRQRRRLALRPGRRHRPDARLGGLPRAAAAPTARRAAHLGPGRAGDRARARSPAAGRSPTAGSP